MGIPGMSVEEYLDYVDGVEKILPLWVFPFLSQDPGLENSLQSYEAVAFTLSL